MDFIERLTLAWTEEGVERREGASRATVAEFENRHGITLPDDVRRFYMEFNGTIGTDEELNAFWSLDEIDSVPKKLSDFRGVPDYGGIEMNLADAENYFVFADHSIWVHVFAMQLRGQPPVNAPVLWIANGRTFDRIAESFAQFWELYLADPNRLIATEPRRR
ncbi:MAG: SMI1/KNR4 family protein [Planctomycetota bacterium]|nr:SMI1/KNR4 family protein [Planctomycetota bacterium]